MQRLIGTAVCIVLSIEQFNLIEINLKFLMDDAGRPIDGYWADISPHWLALFMIKSKAMALERCRHWVVGDLLAPGLSNTVTLTGLIMETSDICLVFSRE